MNTMAKYLIISVAAVLACGLPAAGQTPADPLAIHSAQLAAMNAHDLDKMMSYWAEDGMYDLVSQPPPVPKAYVRAGFQQRFAAYPDFRMEMVRVLATDKVVVEEGLTKYTDTKTGVKITIPHVSIYDIADGKIKKVTSYNDRLGPMVLRGQAPAPVIPPLIPSVALPAPEPTGLSPLAANAELVKRWNGHEVAGIAKMTQKDATIFAGPLGRALSRAEMAALNEMYFQGFSQATIKPVRTVDLGGGWILMEYTAMSPHDGLFLGAAPLGYLVEIRGAWLAHFDTTGLLTQQSFYYDNVTMTTQMTTAPFPPEGIWITAVPTPMGNYLSKTLYTAQDPGKTKLSGTLEWINCLPLFKELYPDADPSLDYSVGGQAVMVGRNKYDATYLGYSRKINAKTGAVEIVGIWTLSAHFEFVALDRIEGYGPASYYLAAQDADQDGFPDAGQKPVVCLPWSWTCKRLTALPGCTPTP